MTAPRALRAVAALLAIILLTAPTAARASSGAPPRPVETSSGGESAESVCRSFSLTAYAYKRPHYPSNRKAELVLNVNVCTAQDSDELDYISSYSCSATSRAYGPRVTKLGGLYSTMTEDFDEIYQRGLRCSVIDGYELFAQVGQDWQQRRPGREPLFACPSVYLFYAAGEASPYIEEVSHDDLERRGAYNGDYSWRCPVWR